MYLDSSEEVTCEISTLTGQIVLATCSGDLMLLE